MGQVAAAPALISLSLLPFSALASAASTPILACAARTHSHVSALRNTSTHTPHTTPHTRNPSTAAAASRQANPIQAA
jgi:septal ring-binding cell division protein DamX